LDALVSSLRGELDSLSTELRRSRSNDEVVMHAAPGNGDGSAMEPQDAEAEDEKGKRHGWLKRRKSALFISTPGPCAVCYRTYAAGGEEELADSGWKVSGELGLCPQCESDGWQLPEGARLPHRRAAD
jgi:hypothetical protein